MNGALPLLHILVKKIPRRLSLWETRLSKKKITIKDLNSEFTIEAMPRFVSSRRKPLAIETFY